MINPELNPELGNKMPQEIVAEMNEKGYFFIGEEPVSEEHTREMIINEAQEKFGTIKPEIKLMPELPKLEDGELIPEMENDKSVFVFAKKLKASEENV